jgi:uncharacterized protein (TIGR02266 family)
MMKLPIKISLRHQGKVLRLDKEAETMTLLDPTGKLLGTVSWESVVDLIQGSVKEARPHKAVRNYPRGRLAAKVRYVTPDQERFEGVTCEIGGGGIFIETYLPPELGAALELELILPDDPTAPIKAQGKVAWVRPNEERYIFFPGMGVQFTEISEAGRERLVTMVKTLDRADKGS